MHECRVRARAHTQQPKKQPVLFYCNYMHFSRGHRSSSTHTIEAAAVCIDPNLDTAPRRAFRVGPSRRQFSPQRTRRETDGHNFTSHAVPRPKLSSRSFMWHDFRHGEAPVRARAFHAVRLGFACAGSRINRCMHVHNSCAAPRPTQCGRRCTLLFAKHITPVFGRARSRAGTGEEVSVGTG